MILKPPRVVTFFFHSRVQIFFISFVLFSLVLFDTWYVWVDDRDDNTVLKIQEMSLIHYFCVPVVLHVCYTGNKDTVRDLHKRV